MGSPYPLPPYGLHEGWLQPWLSLRRNIRYANGAGEIEKMIKDAMPDAEVRIDDLRGDGDHYAAFISSSAFEGKTRVQQHQMVYAALQDNKYNCCTGIADFRTGRRLASSVRFGTKSLI